MNETQLKPHISMTDLGPGYDPRWDHLLAAIMVILALFGVPGNILALKYFTSTSSRNLATCLYMAICVVDTTTSLSHIPIILTLVKTRNPVLFDHVSICVGWKFLFSFLQQFSMFLVTLLSVSRMMAIVFPFHRVSKRRCIIALIIYIVILIAVDIIEAFVSSIGYDSDTCFCYFTARDAKWGMAIEAFWLLKVGPPAIISFINFTVICYTMRSGSEAVAGSEGHLKTRAVVTVSLFTGLFLLCNLPFFVVSALYTVSLFGGYSYPDPSFHTPFMRLYSWVIAKVVFTVLNAALNPVLYYFRMVRFRSWLWNCNTVSDVNTSTVFVRPVSRYSCSGASGATPAEHRRNTVGAPAGHRRNTVGTPAGHRCRDSSL